MRKYNWMIATFALTTLVGSLASAFDEKKIKPEDLPKKVMAAIKEVYPAAKILFAFRDIDDESLYVVELKDDDKAVELAIDDDGKVQAIEKEIDADDLPKAVTRAAAKRFPNGKIGKVEEVTDNEDDNDYVVYTLEITNDGKKLEVVIAPNGKIIATDEDGDDHKINKNKKDKKKEKDDNKA